MRYFLIAGEASGDLHGAALMRELRKHDADALFMFFGGDKMAAEARNAPIAHIRDMAFMGFSAVLRNIGVIRRNMSMAKKELRASHPDALVLIDYPSFNMEVGKTAAKLGIPVFYYIPPKVWAWKQWRARTILKLCTKVFTIFPFENDFYRRMGEVREGQLVYAGNPSVEETDRERTTAMTHEDFLMKYRLRPNRPLVALLPGSRRGEIMANLKVMLETMDRFTQYKGVIIGAPGIEDEFYNRLLDGREIPVLRDEAAHIFPHCRGALVTSGTATLEAALCNTPQVAFYRSNGSKAAYKIMEKILKVKFVTLPNLIADREIIPELLLHNCTADRASEELAKLLRLDAPAREAQLEGFKEIRRILGPKNAPETAASEIFRTIHPGV
ncbi:MAG: lipid-A-disaccharide synthase [Muribaculaceae bacterium]|nr:lipid-A-disaccharide synthase [Muribaculaceae bacterium]